MTQTITIDGIEGLPEVARTIIPLLADNPVAAFYGPMGAGKTTLIRELCGQLGITDNVTSPTFALVNQYDSPDHGPVFHFDFYRIDRIEEAFDLGYEEYFDSGQPCLVEWPEKIEELMPEDTLRITIATFADAPGKRTFTIERP